MALHPDMTWVLRALTSFSLIFGWLSGRMAGQRSHTMWLIIAPLAPAALLALAGREGPVVELVWMAGLTGALLRTLPWAGWSIPEGWRPLAGGWALTICLAWPVIVAREAGFSVAGLFDDAAIVSWAQISAPQAIGWTLHVAMTQLLGLLWLDLLCGLFAREPERVPPVIHGLWIGATLASVVALYQGAFDLSFLNSVNWAQLHRATGTLLDANAYGMCAALAGPLAFVAIRTGRMKHGQAIATIVLIVNVAGMWMSGSRTALIAAIAGMIGVGLASWSSSGAIVRRAAPITAGAVGVLVAVVVLAGGAIGPLGRLFDMPEGAQNPLEQLWNRGGYGTAALLMLRQYPLSGVGLGGFHVIVPDYRVVLGHVMPFDNAQNWWRHEAAELGIFGGAAVLTWSLVIAWRVVAGHPTPRQAFAATTVRWLLLGVGVCSLLGVPTQSPIVLLWFMLLVAWMTVTFSSTDVRWLRDRSVMLSAIVAVLAVAYAVTHVVLARGSLSITARAIRAERPFVTGAYPLEGSEGGEFRWTSREAHFVWPVEGQYLVMRLWAQHPDIARAPVQLTVSTRCGTLLDLPLTSSAPVTLGIALPPGQKTVAATVRASRTWKPSNFGSPDGRSLGAGISEHFSGSGEEFRSQERTAVMPPCLL
jgi:hypothetical protein